VVENSKGTVALDKVCLEVGSRCVMKSSNNVRPFSVAHRAHAVSEKGIRVVLITSEENLFLD